MEKGVLSIIYDEAGAMYFLIFHNQDKWGFVKTLIKSGENEEEALERLIVATTGFKDFKITHKLGKEFKISSNGNSYILTVYGVLSNMNIPVILHPMFDNYLWGRYERINDKLSAEELNILKSFIEEINGSTS